MGSVTPRYNELSAMQLHKSLVERNSIKYHTDELFGKLKEHDSKSKDVLAAEESTAEMNDDVFLADKVLGQAEDFFAEVEAKAKAEAEEQAQVATDMHVSVVEAEDALDIRWIKVEGCWKCME
jgi:hypothetical protein